MVTNVEPGVGNIINQFISICKMSILSYSQDEFCFFKPWLTSELALTVASSLISESIIADSLSYIIYVLELTQGG